MLKLGPFFLGAFTVIWAEKYYYPQPNASTWDDARHFCQLCFKDLVSITPRNAELVVQNLTSELYWIGLRRNISGAIPWTQWSDNAPVTYQNWYPGHPVPKKQSVPVLTYPSLNINDTMQSSTSTQLLACLNIKDDTTSANCSTNTVSKDTEPDAYIEDSCVALLNLGMWWEKHCSDLLPYICYDVVFYGLIKLSNVTHRGGYLMWSQAPGNISHYRVEIRGNSDQTSNETGLTKSIQNLVSGKLYSIQVFPVKCDRDLNSQNVSFYTLPDEIRNLNIVKVEMHNVTLTWSEPNGGHDSYSVTVSGKANQASFSEEYTVINLDAGVLYNFSVCAVVNNSIYGQPVNIMSYTKPSPVANLTSANNESKKIIASWDSPDKNISGYRYHVILGKHDMLWDNRTFTQTNLTPGSIYTLSVSACANGSVEGEAVNISAYTMPLQVSALYLNSTDSSITANWQNPDGNYNLFMVNIFNSSNKIIPFATVKTNQSNCTFNSLKAAERYIVSVVTYLENDDKLVLYHLMTTALQLQWFVSAQSAGVTNLMFRVVYSSPFWMENRTINVTGENTTVISGLKSGSKYYFNVSILAGDLESLPLSINETTVANNRTLTLAMLCSSATNMYCMRDDTMSQVLKMLRDYIDQRFSHDIFWTLEWKPQ